MRSLGFGAVIDERDSCGRAAPGVPCFARRRRVCRSGDDASEQAMSRAFGAFRAATMGEQEDAQEFLAFFLDQLHEEVVEAKKKWPEFGVGAADGSSANSGGVAGGGGGGGGGREGREEEEEDWLEVGKGGAKAVVNAPDPRQKVSRSSVVRLGSLLLFEFLFAGCL